MLLESLPASFSSYTVSSVLSNVKTIDLEFEPRDSVSESMKVKALC